MSHLAEIGLRPRCSRNCEQYCRRRCEVAQARFGMANFGLASTQFGATSAKTLRYSGSMKFAMIAAESRWRPPPGEDNFAAILSMYLDLHRPRRPEDRAQAHAGAAARETTLVEMRSLSLALETLGRNCAGPAPASQSSARQFVVH